MNWEKLGHVYVADGEADWKQSHAYVPTPYALSDDRIRVFVASMDDDNVGRLGYVDVSGTNPTEVLEVSSTPVLDVGERGTFDESGVTPSSIVCEDDRMFLYYFGWQPGVSVRYFLFTGLAVSNDDGESFRRVSKVPILDRTDGERYVRSAPCARRIDGKYVMWYVSGNEWVVVGGQEVPTYSIRRTTATDPEQWGCEKGKLCLSPDGYDEYGFGRPYIQQTNDGYEMWYSVRTRDKGYRIGYAESNDGRSWTRRDTKSGIDVSSTGWDSEMICFPGVISLQNERYMFYNGNRLGETGFGVARLTQGR